MIIPRRKPYFASGSLLKVVASYFNKGYVNETKKLERKLSQSLGIPNPIVVSSGRVGLSLILKYSDLKPNTEIIMPSYTFGPLVAVIKNAGFIPVSVDIDPDNFQMSVVEVKKAINSKTSAIIATHLFGEPCEIEDIMKIAKSKNILIIEDCAQALGATKDNKRLGTFGEVSISSFNIAKPLQGITGGLVFGKNKKIISKIKRDLLISEYNNKGMVKDIVRGLLGLFLSQTIFWFFLMYLFSYEDIQKAFVTFYRKFETKKTTYGLLHPMFSKIILMNITGFEKRLSKRRSIRDEYIKILGQDIKFQKIIQGELGTVDMLVAYINTDVYKLRRYLATKGIDIAILDEIADISSFKFKKANNLFKHSVALPIYESMTQPEVSYVSKYIKRYLSQNRGLN